MKGCFPIPHREQICGELAESLPCKLLLDFGGSCLLIAATSDQVLANLRRVYRYFTVEHAPAPPQHLILLEAGSRQAASLAQQLGRTPDQLDGHVLLAEWFAWGLRIETATLLHYYASKLTRLWVVERWDAEAVTLHAASLCDTDGGGMLLIGEAAAGKTTLTQRFLDDGFRYCSDDTSCISRRDLSCVPFPMAFIVRAERETGEPAAFALRGRAPDIALLDEPRWLVERWEAVGTAFKPRALYFLGPQPGTQVLLAMRPAEAALIVLRNLVMPLGADADATVFALPNFDLACRLAGTARCARVDSSDLDRAHRAILRDYRAATPAREAV